MSRLLVVLAALSGCHSQPHELVRPDDAASRSRADTLLLLLEIEGDPTVEALTLRVDGQPWGTYRVDRGASPHLVSASPARAEDADPTTLGEWIATMDRRLSPGGHVAELASVDVRVGDRVERRAVRRFLPFDVDAGAESAFAGTFRVALGEGSAR
jgi:hypothetical protein